MSGDSARGGRWATEVGERRNAVAVGEHLVQRRCSAAAGTSTSSGARGALCSRSSGASGDARVKSDAGRGVANLVFGGGPWKRPHGGAGSSRSSIPWGWSTSCGAAVATRRFAASKALISSSSRRLRRSRCRPEKAFVGLGDHPSIEDRRLVRGDQHDGRCARDRKAKAILGAAEQRARFGGTARGDHTRSPGGTWRAVARLRPSRRGGWRRGRRSGCRLRRPGSGRSWRGAWARRARGVALDDAAHELCRRPGLVGVGEDAVDGGEGGGVSWAAARRQWYASRGIMT